MKSANALFGLTMMLVATTDFALGEEKPPRGEKTKLGLEMLEIPAGTYQRGTLDPLRLQATHRNSVQQGADLQDERPGHPVEITKPFWIAAREVTVGEFQAFVEATGYQTDAERENRGALAFQPQAADSIDRFKLTPGCNWRKPGFEQTPEHPVVCVSWKDAVAFCQWLSKQEAAVYRLPTEAEWEYAARAGAETIYAGGDEPYTVYAFGNIADAALEAAHPGSAKRQYALRLRPEEGDGFVYTAPVGKFKPNRWGLYDTHGNVWEWCSDRYHDRYYHELTEIARKKGTWAKPAPTVDPAGPEATPQHKHGDWRSLRGGSWVTGPMASRCASRSFGEAGDAFCYAGFRVVREEPLLFTDPAEAATWRWLLERAGRKQHVERDAAGRVKWVGFHDEEKQRGDYYSGSVDLDAEGYVRKITFNAAHFTNAEFERLANFKKLRVLTAWHNGWVKADDKTPYSGAGLSHLKDLPLEAVNFGGSWFNDEGLAAAHQLPHLGELQVYHTRVTDAGILALAGNDRIRRLVIGPQHSQKITERSLSAIATLSELEDLEFNETILTWEGGLKLLVPLAPQLKTLKFDQAFIPPADLDRLKAALPKAVITYTAAKAEQIKQMQNADARR